ncbi:chromosome segregation protein SMC [Rufibacter immobilis]|uniref:Chromosome partition protein Smc n=1 Tax=Rufibacter immobilis TaxID=1348778 RepID=A0A3M9MSG3_9BACT|nr:chromosome segregation protein SMC [Rufibacter immobilis]RNI27843.1 chromosome segregation protein SMC [Rufibacter immobilis]
MELARLEIKGFKSFGDKVTINFDSGITGIVGPNGCGKSNIVDAIRWVLGEQKTRNLRSDKMESVIFNGTKNRKPQQMAEVSLTFNNNKGILPTEYSQVTITRRYYRSGESEYLLNNVTCRLKDINDLFLDTGIGSDSYAIIELKMVDDILTDKDNSRRNLFEEAAGISKFKVRKKQTLKKLEETDADLERVEDVLFEIGKNLKSLERQAKTAERYLNLKEEYRKLSLEYARRNIGHHQEALERLENELKKETDRKGSYSEELAQLEDALQEQKTLLDRTQHELQNKQKDVHEHTSQLRQLENDIKLKSERNLYLQERVKTLHTQINQDTSNISQTEFSLGQLQNDLEQVQEELLISEEQLGMTKKEMEHVNQQKAALQKELQDKTVAQRQLQNEAFTLNKSIEITQVQMQSHRLELERMQEMEGHESEIAQQHETALAETKQFLEEAQAQLATLQEQEEQLRAEMVKTEDTLEEYRQQLMDINRELDAKKNQYSLMKALVDNLEGFPEAIKFLYKSDHWEKPAPLLSDIITPDPAYKNIIETYLEPYMNFFVVDTASEAVEAIELLKEQNKGRANFIILSEVEDMEIPATLSTPKYKAALEVVQAEEKYHPLLRYMLNEVYLTTSAETELFLSDGRTYIVTDGSAIKKPLSLSGGSLGLFDGNRLGRKQNLEKLAEELETLKQDQERMKLKLNTLQQVLQNQKESTQQEQIRRQEQDINALQQELVSHKVRYEQFLLNQQNQASKKDELFDKMQELGDKLADLLPDAESKNLSLKSYEQELQGLTQVLDKQNEIISEVSGIFNQENIKFHQLKNRLQSIQQELAYKQKTVMNHQERLVQLQDELSRAEDETVALDQFVEDQNQLLEEGMVARKEMAKELDEVEKAYFSLRGEIDEKEKTIRELQRKKQNTDEVFQSMQQAITDTRIKLVAVIERLSAEFNMSQEDLAEAPTEVLDISNEELSQQVNAVKQKLDNVGPVNPMAAEAYQEIDTRNQFILTQKNDLLDAKAQLLETISEIDTVAKEKYLTAFEQIKENFMRVFRSLFTEEDTCDLYIADPSNPLESKIEIMARPKGKRPLTINQLSGGEKTLTAISLLFAIYLLKPAPFCIFDEVDAPLDDANIDKFNNIVKKFSHDSQFIVVTHNKRTMVSTDVIYGITMLEVGVSRVIPVDLRDLAPEPETQAALSA